MKYLAILLVAFVGVSNATFFDRPCRENVTVKSNFNVNQYLGNWFEIERYEQMFQEQSDCVTTQYTRNSDGSMNVVSRGRLLDNGTNVISTAQAVLQYGDERPILGFLNFTLPGSSENEDQESNTILQIISTDYFQYSVMWSCLDLDDDQSIESFWVLSRSQEISSTIRDRIDSLIDLYVDRDFIRRTEQNDAVCLDRVSPYEN